MISYLTDKQVSELKQLLEQRLQALLETVRQELAQSDNERYIQLAGRVHDPGDESVADLLTDINLAVIDLHINEIRDIEQALLRIGTYSYGICQNCDGEIAYERLLAYPTAARCTRCQQGHERTYETGAHPSF